jgi:membrane fusion protein, heavy metal efflux system
MKNRFHIQSVSIIFLFALGGWGIYSCQRASETSETPSDRICLDQLEHARFSFSYTEQEHVVETLNLNAKVTFNRDKLIPYVPMSGGTVTKVYFGLGDYIRKGQALVELRSSELAVLSSELTEAQTAYDLTAREKEVAKELHASGIISDRDLLVATNEHLKAKSHLESTLETFEILGGRSGVLTQTITSPSNGYIIEKNVSPGMQIHSGDGPIFTLSDLNEVWVEANVYESELSKIQKGQKVRIKTLAWPDTLFYGQIDHISSILDPVERVLKARISIDNSLGLLKPEMYARVAVEKKLDLQLTTVPTQALIFDRNTYFLIVANDNCDPDVIEVNVFTQNHNKTYLQDHITPGTRIVSENQLLLYQALMY